MTPIPFSSSYQATPWPIAAFNVMTKPGGAACNLACEYCYYRHHVGESDRATQRRSDEGQKREGRSRKGASDVATKRRSDGGTGGRGSSISDELLEHFIADYIQSQDNPTVFFTWQGGEPTLMGLDFYHKVIAFQQKHSQKRQGIMIANAFQTNGVLLDDDWCSFLAKNRFLVGLSIDGPADIHDAYRRMRGGTPTFARVRAAADLLHKHKAAFNTLTTITPANVHRVKDVYDFLTKELGSRILQIQPCVERKDFQTVAHGHWPDDTYLKPGDPRLDPAHPDSLLTSWSISAQEWGEFLCQFFDLWWQDKETVRVNWFDSWASQWVGGPAHMCISSPVCGRALSIEHDGKLYSCDHFVYDEYCIGQLNATGATADGNTLSDLVRSKRQKEFGEAKSKHLPAYCKRCPFLFACYGECPMRRFLRTPDGEKGLNYFCPSYRVFFDHAGKRLAEYGRRFGSMPAPPSVRTAATPGLR